ncbi:MAG: glycosyltransferase, partial [Acetobacteraceae bacterium]|nr:glycosyltransferase [Acetobacteraceae bacterium]
MADPSGWAGARVLMLAPTPTWPLDQGNRRRIHALGQAIRREGAEVHFAHYPSEHDWRGRADPRAHREMAAQWDGYFAIPPTRPPHPPPASGPDHLIDEWWDPAIGTFLDWFFARHRTDALVVHYPFLSRALLHAPPGCLRILDMHDRFAGRREVLARAGIAPEFFHTTEEQEAIALARADLVLAIKREEAAAFRRAARTPVVVLPHAEPPREVPPTPGRGVLRFGIIGARNSINRAATGAFLAALHERLRGTLLPCEILLAGSICAEFPPEALPRYVRRLGPVEDVGAFYAEADVVLAPLAVSTGLKIRVGEALAFGRPVLALAHAFEGYPPQHPFHALPDLPALLAAMERVVAEPALLAELADASRRAAAEVTEQARAGLAACGARLAALPSGCLVPVPAEAAARLPVLLEQALAAAEAMRLPAVVLPLGGGAAGLRAPPGAGRGPPSLAARGAARARGRGPPRRQPRLRAGRRCARGLVRGTRAGAAGGPLPRHRGHRGRSRRPGRAAGGGGALRRASRRPLRPAGSGFAGGAPAARRGPAASPSTLARDAADAGAAGRVDLGSGGGGGLPPGRPRPCACRAPRTAAAAPGGVR